MVYLVNEVTDDEYGCTSVVGVYATLEGAQAYVEAHQYQWSAWFFEGERDALTITSEVVHP